MYYTNGLYCFYMYTLRQFGLTAEYWTILNGGFAQWEYGI